MMTKSEGSVEVFKKKNMKVKASNTSEIEGTRFFTKNAFFLLAHRDRIMKDKRMFLSPVLVQSGLAYTGALKLACLGAYLEWWLSCPAARRMSEEGKPSLVFRLSGSLLTGNNSCAEVYEDGTRKTVHLSGFMNLVTQFARTVDRYEMEGMDDAYSLEEVVDILKKEDEANMNSIQG